MSELSRAHALLAQALAQDERGKEEEAVELYGRAVEVCLRASRAPDVSADAKAKLTKLATQALERAEKIKPPPRRSPSPVRALPPLGLDGLHLRDAPAPATPAAPASPAKGGGYSEEEKRVLARTSLINGREYVPFLSVDLREKFHFPTPYSDRHGKLALSPKQTSKLVGWWRPADYMSDPQVLLLVDCFSVKQTVVSDCSFVASIAISAQYEKRFGKKLITSLIYPQNRLGEPVYNSSGKYMVKLMINGVPRKVSLAALNP